MCCSYVLFHLFISEVFHLTKVKQNFCDNILKPAFLNWIAFEILNTKPSSWMTLVTR